MHLLAADLLLLQDGRRWYV